VVEVDQLGPQESAESAKSEGPTERHRIVSSDSILELAKLHLSYVAFPCRTPLPHPGLVLPTDRSNASIVSRDMKTTANNVLRARLSRRHVRHLGKQPNPFGPCLSLLVLLYPCYVQYTPFW